MSKRVTCQLHGQQETAFVCVHIADAPGKRIGFWWYAEEEVGYEAHCDACEKISVELSEQAWEAYDRKVARDLCLACYRKAAELNGVALD